MAKMGDDRSEREKALTRDLQIFKNNVLDMDIKGFLKKTPGAREALLDGFYAATLLGGGFAAATRNIGKACNIAVLSFAFVSALSWEHRRNQLQREKKVARELVERLNQLEQEKLKNNEDQSKSL